MRAVLFAGCFLLLSQQLRAETESQFFLEKPEPGALWKRLPGRFKVAMGEGPNSQVATHNIGNIQVGHTNLGQIGTGFVGSVVDPVTGEQVPSCIFPANSSLNHLYVAAIWIGAVVGRDTLVSTGADDGFLVHEYWPGTDDIIQHRSIISSDPFYHPEAISEQDLIATFYDTLTDVGYTAQDNIDNRPHRPLEIKVVETSLQWSYEYAGDFVLFDYAITNIGRQQLKDVYMGIYVCGDMHHLSKQGLEAYGDDLCGFKQEVPAECGFADTINLAYVLDNDGDPVGEEWDLSESVRSVAGVRLIRTPSDSLEYSFNWWSAAPGPDFGPRKADTPERPFRDMNGFLGAPRGDRNKYYVMSNGEFDYDQMYVAVDHTADGWLPPPEGAVAFAQGADPKYLLSFGPFQIFPGETLPITFAYIAGEDLHGSATDFKNLLASNPFRPDNFYNSLDFSDFGRNALWASWIYDNPGVDTDGDGNSGKFRVCVFDDTTYVETTQVIDTLVMPPETTVVIETVTDTLLADTTFYEGDGVPDFRGASPPPAPVVRVIPSEGQLLIRWNGLVSETTPDAFSGVRDFEGYRVYSSLANIRSQYTLQTSYDLEDYNRFVFNHSTNEFELLDAPFTLDELQEMYGESFFPWFFGIDNPFLFFHAPSGTDTTYYFAAQDWNRDELNQEGTIRKRFDVPLPSPIADEWTDDDLTEDGYLKYYEYEYELKNLLPSTPLYVAVTAFDYGSPESGLKSLESNPLLNAVQEFPLPGSEEVTAGNLDVVVYPNPYRTDGNYRASGFEGRGDEDLPDERVRAINFINLPPVCQIHIYTLDGDLVRTIEHDRPAGASGSMHESWDLVTRNAQLAVSGVYYYVIDIPGGEKKMGKLVLIM